MIENNLTIAYLQKKNLGMCQFILRLRDKTRLWDSRNRGQDGIRDILLSIEGFIAKEINSKEANQ